MFEFNSADESLQLKTFFFLKPIRYFLSISFQRIMTYDISRTQCEEGSNNLSLSYIFPIIVFTHKQNIIFYMKMQIFLNMWCFDAFSRRWLGDMSYLKDCNGYIDRNIPAGSVTAAGSRTIQLTVPGQGQSFTTTEKGQQNWIEISIFLALPAWWMMMNLSQLLIHLSYLYGFLGSTMHSVGGEDHVNVWWPIVWETNKLCRLPCVTVCYNENPNTWTPDLAVYQLAQCEAPRPPRYKQILR